MTVVDVNSSTYVFSIIFENPHFARGITYVFFCRYGVTLAVFLASKKHETRSSLNKKKSIARTNCVLDTHTRMRACVYVFIYLRLRKLTKTTRTPFFVTFESSFPARPRVVYHSVFFFRALSLSCCFDIFKKRKGVETWNFIKS